MNKRFCFILAGIALIGLTGCGKAKANEETEKPSEIVEAATSESETTEEEKNILYFVDAHGEHYQVEVKEDWKMHDYDTSLFAHEGSKLAYEDGEGYSYKLGVDVSKFQGDIDWAAVKADGYDFVFVRVGYRGYGEAGTLNEDPYAVANMKGARAAGLDVGVYFFSQAINEEEAREEASYAISIIERAGLTSEDITLPIVFDPESISGDDARTDTVTGKQFTANTVAFCNAVNQAGYKSMVYCNMIWEAYFLDLAIIENASIPVWYADYESKPQTPYAFEFWQYTEEGSVAGITGGVDIDIWMIKN